MEALEHYLVENFLRRRTYLHDHYGHIWRGTAREFEYHREDDPPRIWCCYAASLLLRAGSLRCAIDLSFRTGISDRKALRLEETLPELDLFPDPFAQRSLRSGGDPADCGQGETPVCGARTAGFNGAGGDRTPGISDHIGAGG